MEDRILLAVDVFTAIADGYATDTNKDGTFPDLFSTDSNIRVRDYPNSVGYPGDDRGMVEFDVSLVGAGLTVDSAALSFQKNSSYGGNATVDVFAYAADGVLTAADATAPATLVATVVLTSASSYSVPLDAATVQSIYDSGNPIGIRLAIAASSVGAGFGMYSTEGAPQNFPHYAPRLTLTTSGTAVPSLAVRLSPASVAENAGTNAVTGTVERLNADTSAPLTVALSSNDASEAVPSLPNVTIPAGATTTNFTLDVIDDDLLDGDKSVQIYAAAAGLVSGVASVLVTDYEVLSVTAADASVVESAGAGATTITVTRSNTNISAPLTVTLSDTNPRLTVPASATILANETSVTVPVDVIDTEIVDGNATVFVKANAAGYKQGQTTIVVLDDDGGRIRPGNILVAIENGRVQEFKPDGTLIQTFGVFPQGGSSGQFRDLVVNDQGDIELINGNSVLSNIDVVTKAVTNHTAPDWSTGGNLTAGGVARLGQYLYVNDVGTTRGVIRFDTLHGYATTRANTTFDIHDVTIGLDGKLYALESGGSGNRIAIINPLSMQVLGTITLQATTHRGIAVNAAGEIFATGWQESLYKYNSQGNLVDFLATGWELDDIDIDSTGRIVAAGDAFSLSNKYVVMTDERFQTLSYFPVTNDLELFVAFADPDTTAVTPVVTTSGTPATLTENGSSAGSTSVIIDPNLTLSDDGNVMKGAVVRITGNYVKGQDSLSAFSQNFIVVQPFDSKTGTLRLTGSASVADYQTALRSVRYVNSSNSPDTNPRTITFSAIDEGWAGSGDATVLVVSSNDGLPVANNDSYSVVQDGILQISPVVTNRLTLQSDTGEFVGQGQNYTLNGFLSIAQQYNQGVRFKYDNGSSNWNLEFWTDAGPLAVGSYPVATRLGGNGTGRIDISGNGRGSGRHFGSFDVQEVEFEQSGTLIRFAASFVQYTESKSKALRGTIDYRSTHTTKSGVIMNDTDTDGGRLTVISTTTPANGAVVMNTNGTFTYTPAAGFFGPDSFDYTLRDSDGATTTATVTINVTPTPGLTVTGAPLRLSEAGATDTFDVVLNVQPSSNVVLVVTSNDTSEASVNKTSLTFTPANWNVAQTVTVTGVDDYLDDGDQSTTITISVNDAASADEYDSVADVVVSSTTTDDDTAGFTVTETGGGTAVSESGTTDLLNVVLDAQPITNVVLNVSSGNPGEVSVSTATLTFTPANWNTVQTVTVTGVDDAIVDGVQVSVITISVNDAASDDVFDDVADATISVTNVDNDTGSISFNAAVSSASEGVATHHVNVRLTLATGVTLAAPVSVDVVDLLGGTAAAGTDYGFATQTVTFNPGDGNGTIKSVSLSVVDDPNVEGDETVELGLANLIDGTGGQLTLPGVGAVVTFSRLVDQDSYVRDSDGDGTFETSFPTNTTSLSTAKLQPPRSEDRSILETDIRSIPADATVVSATLRLTPTFASSGTKVYDLLGYSGDGVVSNSDATASTNIVGIVTVPGGNTSTQSISLDTAFVQSLIGTADYLGIITRADQDEFINFHSTEANVPLAKKPTLEIVYVTPSHSVTIADNDIATVSFALAGSSVSESVASGSHDVTVSLYIPSGGTLDRAASVDIRNLGSGTADSGDFNFNTSPKTVAFPAGSTTGGRTVSISILDDLHVEGDDTIEVDLHNLTDGTNGQVAIVAHNEHTVTILDDDVATIAFASPSSSIGESAGAHSIAVKIDIPGGGSLLRAIAVDVELNATSPGTAAGGSDYDFAPQTLTFYVLPFETTKSVTLDILPDALLEGNETINLKLANLAQPAGALVSLGAPSDHTVTIVDDESSQIVFDLASSSASESRGSHDVAVRLVAAAGVTIAPGVTLTAEVIDAGSGTATSGSDYSTLGTQIVSFGPGAGNGASSVVALNVVDDLIDDDAESVVLAIGQVTGPSTSVGVQSTHSVMIVDDDIAGIVVSSISGNTTEAGGFATFTVVLNSEPTADVTIGLTSGDVTEGNVSPASLTFTTANWNVARTVTVSGVDDAVDDGDVAYSIITAASSSDANYDGLAAADVSVTNIDDDTAGITVSAISGNTTESGATATFTVVLNSEPTADVTIGLSSSDTTEGTVSSGALTFTAANWNTVRTVTVTGVNDDVDDGDIAYSVITAAANSSDANYGGMNAVDVSVTNIDDDTAGITVSAISGNTTESGATATFTVVLNSEPTADVTIGLASSDPGEGTTSTNQLTIGPGDWNVPHLVTITGVDDLIVDGDIVYTILLAAATSGDRLYGGLDPPDVVATNLDNDVPVVFSYFPISGTLVDGGTSYTAGLEPTADPFNANILQSVDGVAQSIREGEALVGGGKKPKQSSALDDYRWSFGTVTNVASFRLTAWRDANGEGDDFNFEYSLDGGNWTALATVANATSQAYAVNLSSTPLNGDLVVRVVDTNRSPAGRRDTPTLEAVHIDSISFESVITDLRTRVNILVTDASAAESPLEEGRFTLSREGTTGDLQVFYTVSGSATAGIDYALLTGTATIPDGQTSTTITITPIDDSDAEGDETVIVTLAEDDSYGYKPGASASATVTIVDNDLRVYTATGESTIAGSIVGNSHTATADADGVFETIEEFRTGGKPASRTSFLDHRWTFAGVNAAKSFYLTASRPDNTDGDDFAFQYSIDDGSNWIHLATVSTRDSTLYPVSLPTAISGTILVRVIDTDANTPGNSNRDTVEVDQMYFSTAPLAPLVVDGSASVAGGSRLSQAELDTASQQALSYWQWQAAHSASIAYQPIAFEIVQIANPYLGLAYPAQNRIQVDVDAAGFGWSRVSLVSTLIHEIGHLYGHGHEEIRASLAVGTHLTHLPELSSTPWRNHDVDHGMSTNSSGLKSIGINTDVEDLETLTTPEWRRHAAASSRTVLRSRGNLRPALIDELFAGTGVSHEPLDDDLIHLLAELERCT